MKSGLEDRNNAAGTKSRASSTSPVSMKSGLEDRNNLSADFTARQLLAVSMKSGLEDRNNS